MLNLSKFSFVALLPCSTIVDKGYELQINRSLSSACIQVPDEILIDRCVGRRLDPVTKKIYHVKNFPPETEEISSRLITRPDDTEEKVIIACHYSSHFPFTCQDPAPFDKECSLAALKLLKSLLLHQHSEVFIRIEIYISIF